MKKERQINKAFAISDARISFVSLVDKAANKRRFLITKAENGTANFSSYGRIIKADAEHHYVTGIVYEPLVEDTDGNYMTEEEITKAAYWYAKNGDKVDIQHSFEALPNACVVENWIAKADFDCGGEKITKGTWLMTVEVTDEDVWRQIEKGEITGFSMGGVGNYSEEDENLADVNKSDEKVGLLAKLAGMLGVEKAAVKNTYSRDKKDRDFWSAWDALQHILRPACNTFEDNPQTIREALSDFSEIITELLTSDDSIMKSIAKNAPAPLKKSGRKLSDKNKQTLNGIYNSLGEFLKSFDDKEHEEAEGNAEDNKETQEEDKELTRTECEAIVSKSVTEKLAAAGITAPETDTEPVAKAQEGNTTALSGAELTEDAIAGMVEKAINKALAKNQLTAEPPVTPQQVDEMITKAVNQRVNEVLKARSLPSNLNAAAGTGESRPEPHYMHGML